MRISRISMELDNALIGDAGGLVQAVDILRYNGSDRAAADQLRNGAVTAVWGCCAKSLIHCKTPPPGFAARLLGGEKIREVDRRHAGPDPAGAAEIGNARLGADAGSGKDDRAARSRDRSSELGNFSIDRHAVSLANVPRRAKLGVRSWRP
jgi:hypothetical protein